MQNVKSRNNHFFPIYIFHVKIGSIPRIVNVIRRIDRVKEKTRLCESTLPLINCPINGMQSECCR